MFTTVTPGAHEFSMARRAATPPNEAPYPTLVGTATSGTPVRPPTTDHEGLLDLDAGTVAHGEQPVQAGHAHVVDPVDRGAVHAHRQRGLGRDGGVGGAGADDRDGAARFRERS